MQRSDLELVSAIQQQGSLSAAALSLDLAAPVVSKRLAALESALGQRLFQRTTRRVSATAEGLAFCDRARELLRGFAELEADIEERKAEPTGLIRLAATFGFGRLWLGPALAAFQQRHPRVQVQLQLTEQLPDLARDGYDGAIWLWSVQGSRANQWVSRRLARNQRVLAAAPAYLKENGLPATLEELQGHDCLIVRENGPVPRQSPSQSFDVWSLQKARDRVPVHLRVKGALSSNSGELVRDWCLQGRGIMLRSLWDIAPQLASGELVQVLPAYAMADADIHWLAPYRDDAPRRIRLLIDFLVQEFDGEPWKTTPPVSALRPAPRGSRPRP